MYLRSQTENLEFGVNQIKNEILELKYAVDDIKNILSTFINTKNEVDIALLKISKFMESSLLKTPVYNSNSDNERSEISSDVETAIQLSDAENQNVTDKEIIFVDNNKQPLLSLNDNIYQNKMIIDTFDNVIYPKNVDLPIVQDKYIKYTANFIKLFKDYCPKKSIDIEFISVNNTYQNKNDNLDNNDQGIINNRLKKEKILNPFLMVV